MSTILSLYQQLCEKLSTSLNPWLLPHLARFSFAAVLFCYYWNSALTKFSEGPLGFFQPNIDAYYQILPTVTEAVGYDVDKIGFFYTIIVVLGSWAEVILPLLIVIGLFTRVSALAMIGFVIVQSLTDIYGHGIDMATRGSWFDGFSDGLLDQRLLWVSILVILVVKGAGWLSVDYALKIDRKD